MNEIIEFKCGKCSYPLKENVIHAGKNAKCPACKALTKIPTCSNNTPADRSQTPRLVPATSPKFDKSKKTTSAGIPKEGWVSGWKLIGTISAVLPFLGFLTGPSELGFILMVSGFGAGITCFWLAWLTEILVQMRYVSSQQLEHLKRLKD